MNRATLALFAFPFLPAVAGPVHPFGVPFHADYHGDSRPEKQNLSDNWRKQTAAWFRVLHYNGRLYVKSAGKVNDRGRSYIAYEFGRPPRDRVPYVAQVALRYTGTAGAHTRLIAIMGKSKKVLAETQAGGQQDLRGRIYVGPETAKLRIMVETRGGTEHYSAYYDGLEVTWQRAEPALGKGPAERSQGTASFVDLSGEKGAAFVEVARLPLRWLFREDPKNVGQKEQWHRVDLDDREWDRILITRAWERQGYLGLDGYGWYRLRVHVPNEIKTALQGRPAAIRFGAVDEEAWVYVNGRLAGRHTEGPNGWDKPFAIPAAEMIRFGEQNMFAVRVYDSVMAGGIWKEVSLGFMRTPGQPEEAQPPAAPDMVPYLRDLLPNSDLTEMDSARNFPTGWAVRREARLETASEISFEPTYRGREGCLRLVWCDGPKLVPVGPAQAIPAWDTPAFRLTADVCCERGGRVQLDAIFLDENSGRIGSASSEPESPQGWRRLVWDFAVPLDARSVQVSITSTGRAAVWLDRAALYRAAHSSASGKAAMASDFPLDVDCWPVSWNARRWNQGRPLFHTIHRYPVPIYFVVTRNAKSVAKPQLLIEVPKAIRLPEATIDSTTELITRGGADYERYTLALDPSRRSSTVLTCFETRQWEKGKTYRVYYRTMAGGQGGKERMLLVRFMTPFDRTKARTTFRVMCWRNAWDLRQFADPALTARMMDLYESTGMMNTEACSRSAGAEEPLPAYRFYTAAMRRGWCVYNVCYNAMRVAPWHLDGVRRIVEVTGKPGSWKIPGGYRVCPSWIITHEDAVTQKMTEWNRRRNRGAAQKGQKAKIDYEPGGVPRKYCFCEPCKARFCERHAIDPKTIEANQDILAKYPVKWAHHWRDMIARSYGITERAIRNVIGEGEILDYNYYYNMVNRDAENDRYLLSMPKDARTYESHIDTHGTSYYHAYGIDGFRVLDKQVRLLQKPIAPFAYVGCGDGVQDKYPNIHPAYFRAFTLNAASAGCPYVCVYPGRCMDGLYFVYGHRALLELETVLDYYQKGKRKDRAVSLDSPPRDVGFRVHAWQGRLLLTVFNYANSAPADLTFKRTANGPPWRQASVLRDGAFVSTAQTASGRCSEFGPCVDRVAEGAVHVRIAPRDVAIVRIES